MCFVTNFVSAQAIHLDPLEFVSVQANTLLPNKQSPCENLIPQLKNYPMPRYKTGNKLNKNYPWLPANCFPNHVDYTIDKQNNGNTKEENINASNASAFLELARHWNYYFPVTLNTKNGYDISTKVLTDSANLTQNYPLKTCATTYWPQTTTNPDQQPALPYPAYPIKPDTRGIGTPPPRKMYEPNPTKPNVYYICDEDNYYPGGYIYNLHLASEYYLHRIDTLVEGAKQIGYFENAEPRYKLGTDRATCRTKLLSPLAPLGTYGLDGEVAAYQLDLVNSMLHRPTPIDIINENGEVEHLIPADLKDPLRNRSGDILRKANIVDADYANNFFNGLTSQKRKMRYYFTQGIADRYDAYTSLNKQNYPNTLFTIYQQEGNTENRPEWNIMRNTTSDFIKNGTAYKYSTAQYYPFQQFWKWGCCAFDGLDFTEDSRENEIFRTDFDNNPLPPDPYYSPFVAAGWEADEEFNIRPAQWLGLMKNHVAMGAEFFYTGFFGGHFYKSTSYPTYNRINASDLNAANYAWQAAMPSYAQALTSYVNDFYFDSELLWRIEPIDPHDPSLGVMRDADLITSLPDANDYPLATARKGLGSTTKNQYLITMSLQPAEDPDLKGKAEPLIPRNPASNQYPVSVNVPTQNAINAPTFTVTANARRQGSTYFLDNSSTVKKIFYQLDGWHQWQHPHHWNKDSIAIEAELYDADPQANTILRTQCHTCTLADPYNFTDFVTYTTDGTPEYKFEVRAGGCTWSMYGVVRSNNTHIPQHITGDLYDENNHKVNGMPNTIDIGPSAIKPAPPTNIGNWQEKYLFGDITLPAGTYTLRLTNRSPSIHIDRLIMRKITFDCGCQN
jgi:hypothetical protein